MLWSLDGEGQLSARLRPNSMLAFSAFSCNRSSWLGARDRLPGMARISYGSIALSITNQSWSVCVEPLHVCGGPPSLGCPAQVINEDKGIWDLPNSDPIMRI